MFRDCPIETRGLAADTVTSGGTAKANSCSYHAREKENLHISVRILQDCLSNGIMFLVHWFLP